ncbi:hypothetical protein CLS_31280 [[Clostridium] cf. saccharolyticum K10]|nr:hypothetical protein CLS_31280 [[Clostridium] cf. saccharolyticum K10]
MRACCFDSETAKRGAKREEKEE